MVAIATDAMLPLCSYKSQLLTSKPKAYHHFPLESFILLKGDKHKINHLI